MDLLRQRRPSKTEQEGDDKSNVPIRKDQEWLKQLVIASVGVLGTIFILKALYLLFAPCPIRPEAHTFDPIPRFEGPLKLNNELKNIEKIKEGAFRGPESLVAYNGKIYTGVSDGRIVEIDIETHELRTVVETLGAPPCGIVANEKNCGRPLGLRIKDGYIYAVDAYLGLFKIDIATGEKVNLFRTSEPLSDGYPIMFLNDIDVSVDGKIYLTDSSYQYGREDHPYAGWEGSAKGRLIQFDPATNTTQILSSNLYFANGLQLSTDGDSLLISETTRCRIMRYFLRGPRAGETEIFSNNLPGLPDNIRPSSGGGYWVALAFIRHPEKLSTWDVTSPYPCLRCLMVKTLNKYSLWHTLPSYGLVLELNSQGQIVRSLHDQDGSTFSSSSEVCEYDGHLYFGSFFLPFVSKYKIQSTL